MEKGFGFGFDQHMLPPSLNLSRSPYINGYPNADPSHRYPYTIEDSMLRNLPLIPNHGFQQSKASEPYMSHNWFYHKPYFHQAFTPISNSAFKEKFPVGQSDIGLQRNPIPSQKRFLVFDQSGDKTTLLYTSAVPTPVKFGAFPAPNPPTYNIKEKLCGLNDENSREITDDEMHENTEELDALLCSDDESNSSEDDETSTAHSPSTMTDNKVAKPVKESGEEVDSFSLPTKRRRLLDGRGYVVPSLKNSELESDAESSCCSRIDPPKEEVYSRAGCKRSRRDEIHETVSILQSIIPNGDGKDAIVVIDEAIHYLRSLKVKAEALGLNAI